MFNQPIQKFSNAYFGGNLYVPDYQEGNPIIPPFEDALLNEDGSFLLNENGSLILLEG